MAGLSNGKGRLIADPAIAVGDLMAVINGFLKEQGSRDLERLLQIPRGASWKTGLNIEWMAALSELFKGYARVAPNTILPPKKHRSALLNLQGEEKINYGKKSDEDFCDYMDQMIRVCFGQFRQLAQSPDVAERAFRRASPSQVRAVEEVLALLSVAKDISTGTPTRSVSSDSMNVCSPVANVSQAAEAVESSIVPSSSSPPAVVPEAVVPEAVVPEAVAPEGVSRASPSSPVNPEELFASILAADHVFVPPTPPRVDSVPEQPTTPTRCSAAKRTSCSPLGFENFLQAEGLLVGDNAELLERAVETVPLGSDGKVQLQIFRENVKKPQPGPKKGGNNQGGPAANKKKPAQQQKKKQARPAPAEVDEGDCPPEVVSQKQQKKKAKPAPKQIQEPGQTVEVVPANKVKVFPEQEITTRVRGKQSLSGPGQPISKKKKNKKCNKKKKPAVPKVKDQSRTARRKRLVSKAWHDSYDLNIARGVCDERARRAARKAHKVAGMEFDAKEPRRSKKPAAKKPAAADVGGDV